MRDFCENQIEINTDPFDSAEEALEALRSHESKLAGILEKLPEREYLWPFSNPPYIRGEDDIPIAAYEDSDIDRCLFLFCNGYGDSLERNVFTLIICSPRMLIGYTYN